MIRFIIIIKVFLLLVINIVVYAKSDKDYKWKCDKCGKVNVVEYSSALENWDGKINGCNVNDEDTIKKYNEKMIKKLEYENEGREEFEKNSSEERKKLYRKTRTWEGSADYVPILCYRLRFNDESYICDDRIVKDGGEKHKAKFKGDYLGYYVFAYKGIAYVCCDAKHRCRYCWDGGKEDDECVNRCCIDLSKIREKNKDGFCKFGTEGINTKKVNLCCFAKMCGCKSCRSSVWKCSRDPSGDPCVRSRSNKLTDWFQKLESDKDKWCRFEDCRGVVIEDFRYCKGDGYNLGPVKEY